MLVLLQVERVRSAGKPGVVIFSSAEVASEQSAAIVFRVASTAEFAPLDPPALYSQAVFPPLALFYLFEAF